MMENLKKLKDGVSPTGVARSCCAFVGHSELSALDVCNAALGLLGRAGIAGLGGGSQASLHCSLMFHPMRRAVLRDFGVEGNVENLSEWGTVMLEAFVLRLAWVLGPVGGRAVWWRLYRELVDGQNFVGAVMRTKQGGRH